MFIKICLSNITLKFQRRIRVQRSWIILRWVVIRAAAQNEMHSAGRVKIPPLKREIHNWNKSACFPRSSDIHYWRKICKIKVLTKVLVFLLLQDICKILKSTFCKYEVASRVALVTRWSIIMICIFKNNCICKSCKLQDSGVQITFSVVSSKVFL